MKSGNAATAGAKRKAAKSLTSGLRGVSVFLFIVSGIINVLALTGSVYMLQIYDRALTSGNVPTLAALSALAIGLYLFQGTFDIIRSQILVRVGARLDAKIAPLAHQVAIDMPRFGFSTAESLERGRDVDTVRGFLGSQGPAALFDLPWVPLYLVFIYLLHPFLGMMTLGGALVLTMLTIVTEILTRRLAAATQQAVVARNAIADSNARNAEILKAMGFAGRAVTRFNKANAEHLDLQTETTDIGGTFAAISRVLRMLLQSAILGLGAYLTILGELSAGAIIAASVASARALAPVDLAIANWKGVVQARTAFQRLKETLAAMAQVKEPMQLPAPKTSLKVEKLTVAAPSNGRVLLSEIDLELKAGQALGVIGPSGGGKTTFARSLVGIWPALRGSVRLDDAELTQWPDDDFGHFIGYLPQDVALLDGTIAENISRLDPDFQPRDVVEAARAAGVHEMILRLPDGYDTALGPNGAAMSAGQRQRLALARALYKNPFLVIMDEPNSNLDGEGEAALTQAIEGVRERGGIAVVIAHRPSALAAVSHVAVIQGGKLTSFGLKADVLGPKAPGLPANPLQSPDSPRVQARVSA